MQKKSRTPQRTCFVLIPFRPDFDELYENTIRPAIETTRELACLRADEIYGPRPIMADIWKSINDASILVADLTGRNPNVLYELGLAHARHKPVVLIVQDMRDVPFDLRAIRCLIYTNTQSGRALLLRELKKTVKELAVDLRRRKRDRLEEYVVLPRFAKQTTPEHRPVEFSPDSLREPWRIITALRRRSDQLKGKRRKQKPTQSEIEVVLSLLQEDSVDVKLAALGFLRDHIDSTHTPAVFPLLESEDAPTAIAAVGVIEAHSDTICELQLLRKLNLPIPDDVRMAIIQALSAIGSDMTKAHCRAVLEAEGSSSQSRSEAVRILASVDISHLLHVCLVDEVIQRLSANDRIELLANVGRLEGTEILFDAEITIAVKHILKTLYHDLDPRVRGQVLALWLLCGQKEYGEVVNREDGWDLVEDRASEALRMFIDGVGDDCESLMPEDGVRLVGLVEGNPVLEERILWHLQHLAAPGVEDFMLRFVNPGEDGSLWALAYFADRPTGKAAQACKNALASTDSDVSEKVLAAICLARLGDKASEGFIVEHVAEAHIWIGVIARRVLEPLAEKKTKKGKVIRQILQEIPESW